MPLQGVAAVADAVAQFHHDRALFPASLLWNWPHENRGPKRGRRQDSLVLKLLTEIIRCRARVSQIRLRPYSVASELGGLASGWGSLDRPGIGASPRKPATTSSRSSITPTN